MLTIDILSIFAKIMTKACKMRIFFLSLLLYSLRLATAGAQTNSVDHFFAGGNLKTASYSIYVLDAKSGVKICETAQKSLSTASVMKLLTTACALEKLGPDYTFATSLYFTGTIDKQSGTLTGNLILKGGGDPAFCSAYFPERYNNCFDNWVRQLKTGGIKKINGQLAVDLSSLPSATIPGGWVWEDIGNYYGTGVSALSYKDNQYEIHLSSPKATGMKTAVTSLNPEIAGLQLGNQVRSSPLSGDRTIVFGAPGSYKQRIEGTIPAGQTDFVVKAAMPDPPLVAAQEFLKKLKEAGIEVTGQVSRTSEEDHTPRNLVGTQLSPPLKELIVPLNKESLNLYAEHLLCEIGLKSSGEATTAKGIEALQQYLEVNGIDTQGFFPADGSGLSRSNAITSKTLVETLKLMYDGKYRKPYFDSLPVAGVDGTLKNAFKGTPLERNVMAKTGSMAHVRSIAGLMTTRSKRTILFAILINNFGLTSPETGKLLESILLSFYND